MKRILSMEEMDEKVNSFARGELKAELCSLGEEILNAMEILQPKQKLIFINCFLEKIDLYGGVKAGGMAQQAFYLALREASA